MISILTPQQLVDYRENLVDSSRSLRKQGHHRLRIPLLLTEEYLGYGITISPIMAPSKRIQAQGYLSDCENLINSLNLWDTQNAEPSWVELRPLIEEFSLQLMESKTFDIFVVKSDRTTVIPLASNGHGFAVIHLKSNFIDDPRHWCLCGHEISHLNQKLEEVRFTPKLPNSKNSPNYQNAIGIWSGEILPKNAWFIEVLGDLWSCQIIGPGYSLGFSNYRPTVGDIPNVGVRKHPPSDLRLTLMARFLNKHGFSKNVVPKYTPLGSLLPTLRMDDSDYGGALNNLKEVFDLTLIEEVERISREFLKNLRNNTSIILQNFKEIESNSALLNNDLVTDVGGLAMFCHASNASITQYIDELKEEYL